MIASKWTTYSLVKRRILVAAFGVSALLTLPGLMTDRSNAPAASSALSGSASTTGPPSSSFTSQSLTTVVPSTATSTTQVQTSTPKSVVNLLDSSATSRRVGPTVETEIAPRRINGKAFDAVLFGTTCCAETQGYQDFDLSRAFTTLTGRVGLMDRSDPAIAGRIQLIADGSVIYDREFTLGQSEDIVLTVTQVLRLRVRFLGDLERVYPAIGGLTVLA